MIRLLLSKEAKPTLSYLKKFREGEHVNKVLSNMAIRIFVLGNPGVGKSTLVKAVKEVDSSSGQFFKKFAKAKVKGVETGTAGIIPYDIQSDKLGNIIMYDCAGDREFHAGHETVISSSLGSSATVILLVINMTDEDQKMSTTLQYWLELINNKTSKKYSKPRVIIIGSHADLLKRAADIKSKSELIAKIKDDLNYDGYEFIGQVNINCCRYQSKPMNDLHCVLSENCKKIREAESMAIESHYFHLMLLEKFSSEPAITIQEADTKLTEISDSEQDLHFKFLKSENLIKICEQLNDHGKILFIKNHKKMQDSWVVLNEKFILSEVYGTIIAGIHKEYKKKCTDTGVVCLSELTHLFPDLSPNLIVQVLCYMEYCHEIQDVNLLSLLSSGTPSSSPNERYFFFPELVALNKPQQLWHSDDQQGYYTGWIIHCTEKFSSRFFKALILRLTFRFALTQPNLSSPEHHLAQQTIYRVWNKGIFWSNIYGGEAIVDIVEDNQLIIMTRSTEGKIVSMQLRSAIMSQVLDTKEELCPNVKLEESFIHPSDVLDYQCDPNKADVRKFSIVSIAKTVAKCGEYVIQDNKFKLKLVELLPFEPYAIRCKEVLKSLFDEASPNFNKPVSDKFIRDIDSSTQLSQTTISYIELFANESGTQIILDRDTHLVFQMWREIMGAESTLSNLRKKLDLYSVFVGRNPYLLAGRMHAVYYSY